MNKKFKYLFFVLICLLFIGQSNADERIITQQDVVEADKIILKLNKNTRKLTLLVSGCEKCPLELDATYGVRFFLNNKLISKEKAKLHSGKPGTIIYNADKDVAISARW